MVFASSTPYLSESEFQKLLSDGGYPPETSRLCARSCAEAAWPPEVRLLIDKVFAIDARPSRGGKAAEKIMV